MNRQASHCRRCCASQTKKSMGAGVCRSAPTTLGRHGCWCSLSHTMSRDTSSRLQNDAIKYCTKVMRKTGPVGQRVKYFCQCLPTPAPCFTDIRADLVLGHTGYDVTSYFRLAFNEVRKNGRKCRPDGFGSNFSGASCCLPPLIGGHLVLLLYNFLFFFLETVDFFD